MTELSHVQFGKTTIPFAIRRTKREKTVALRVEGGGRLVVMAPSRVPVQRLEDIVRRKGLWVLKRVRRASDIPPPPAVRELVSGETLRYLGRQYRLRVLSGERAAGISGSWCEVRTPPGVDARAVLVPALQEQARRYIERKLRAVCRRMGIAQPPLLVCDQRVRWGSCTKAGVVRINWRIIQARPALIEYVLVHELVHLSNRSHDRAFWRTVGRWVPDYDDRRDALRELGPSLVW